MSAQKQFETRIIRPSDSDYEESFAAAVEALKAGETVAFPTETVYGLAAIYDSAEAVRKIYEVKGRPQDNPLIVHLYDFADLDRVVASCPADALRLWEEFAPGPLTLILPRHPLVPKEVSAGLATVAVRFPEHPLARDLIQAVGKPLVAPSANSSGRPSPTQALHVFADLAGKIPYILDGGECNWGLESTVLDLCQKPYRILRPGAISKRAIEALLGGSVLTAEKIAGEADAEAPVRAPGMKYKHYAPKIPVRMMAPQDQACLKAFQAEFKNPRVYLISSESLPILRRLEPELLPLVLNAEAGEIKPSAAYYLSYDEAKLAAQQLFAAFRQAEGFATAILVEAVKDVDLGPAFLNRLEKAAAE